jgi:hypothetical protein
MNNKSFCIILFFILFSTLCFAEPEDIIYSAKTLTLDHSTTSAIYLTYGSSKSELMEINAYVTYIPQNTYRQQVLKLNYDPKPASTEDNTVLFSWEDPKGGSLPFAIASTIETRNSFLPINKKIPFPIRSLPNELRKYTQPAPNIDITDEITLQANRVVEGKDDLFLVVHSLAEWVETNIDYSLNTVTADAVMSSSWVFKERQGVCDELTTLFMAMLRSVGIPARFISGISYTTSTLFDEKWSSHAWTEVYFPDVGWVPFDITYKQFGFIDASHIKLRDSVDANSSLTQYGWKGYDLDSVNIKLAALDFDTEIVKSQGEFNHPAIVSPRLFTENSGFGSHNRIEITVTNPTDLYLSIPIMISTSSELAVDTDYIIVSLKPKEKVTKYVIFKLNDNLDVQLHYKLPINIATQWADIETLWLEADKTLPIYSRDILEEEEQEVFVDEKEFSFSCNAPATVAVYQNFVISCNVVNTGTNFFEDMKLCQNNDCSNLTLGIGQEKDVEIPLLLDGPGNYILSVKATEDGKYLKQVAVNVTAEDRPSITIIDLDAPKNVDYNNAFNITFALDVVGTAHNVVAKLDNGYTPLVWQLGRLEATQPLTASLQGNFLNHGENTLKIDVKYHDIYGNSYTTEETVNVELTGTSFFSRLWLKLIHFIEKLG